VVFVGLAYPSLLVAIRTADPTDSDAERLFAPSAAPNLTQRRSVDNPGNHPSTGPDDGFGLERIIIDMMHNLEGDFVVMEVDNRDEMRPDSQDLSGRDLDFVLLHARPPWHGWIRSL
jgi:hypothetical protein